MLCLLAPAAFADMMNFHGKVVMEDGTPPGRLVGIQRTCPGGDPVREGNTSAKTGEYFIRLYLSDSGEVFSGAGGFTQMLMCYLEAVTPGYKSTHIDLSDRRILANPQFPTMVLSPQPPGALVDLGRPTSVPAAARKTWDRAVKALAANNWAASETTLREVVAAAPEFAVAWSALGAACMNQQKPEEARKALARAIALDPKPLPPYQALAEVELQLKDWPAALQTSAKLIAADSVHSYLEAYLDNAIARFQLKDLDRALERMNELIRLDRHQDLPRSEYILGMILEAKGDLEGAAAHMRKYVAEHPRARDVAAVTERIANLGKRPETDLSVETVVTTGIHLGAPGEAAVPGGIQAFSRIALMPPGATYQNFFLEYCRALLAATPDAVSATAEVSADIRAFISTMSEFEQVGERSGDRLVVRLQLGTPEQRRKTAHAIALLGWRLQPTEGGYDVELGDLPVDGARQRIPAALGIDELALREAMVAGRPFTFEIPVENARLIGGAAWTATLKDRPDSAYGPIDIFLRDPRFANAYAGVAKMEPDTAAAVVSGVGMVPLIKTYSVRVAEFGESLALAGEHAAVPGGVAAEPVWSKLAGAEPANPQAFFKGLIDRNNGLLLAFFFDLSRADAAHQKFFTARLERAQAFYSWYMDSVGVVSPHEPRWQAAILQNVPLDGDVDALLKLPSLEPLAAELSLEHRRGRPLDAKSAELLTRHFAEWRWLIPYFEKLPGLSEPQFEALAAFTDRASSAQPAQREVLLGEWHSLVELIALGSEAGGLTAEQAAEDFGKVCQALTASNSSAQALELVRGLASAANPDEWISSGLLRLSGDRLAAFERVKQLQGVPPLATMATMGANPDARKLLAALSGQVYAALLDPRSLLVAEDGQLLAKHDFVPARERQRELFANSGLAVSSGPAGSHFTGGFGRFRETIARLDQRTAGQRFSIEAAANAPAAASTDKPAGAPAESGPVATDAVFKASGRIVEVYASVVDSRGRYMDGLKQSDFAIEVERQTTGLFAFENQTASVSVALLFDTTGSMGETLPSLKRAAMSLVEHLRPGDSAAVYGFNKDITEFQSFTEDKTAIQRAILRAHAAGPTALYDALVRVNRDLAQRQGKKVTIVFTDGDDNSSLFSSDAAILRAKSRGIPIYTIAEGEALQHPRLVAELANLSKSTGGSAFLIRKLADIEKAFQKVSEDLMHGYLLAFQPPADNGSGWRKISVATPGRKGLIIRAREGYFPE